MQKLIIDEQELNLSFTIQYQYRLNNVVYVQCVINNSLNKLVKLNTRQVMGDYIFDDYIKSVIYDHFKELNRPLCDVIIVD